LGVADPMADSKLHGPGAGESAAARLLPRLLEAVSSLPKELARLTAQYAVTIGRVHTFLQRTIPTSTGAVPWPV
jgi:hypothetical protein